MSASTDESAELHLAIAETATVEGIAAQLGCRVERRASAGLGLDEVITLTVSGGAAVHTVVFLLERWRGGQVIDLRSGAAKPFYRSRSVQYGTCVVVDDFGVRRFETLTSSAETRTVYQRIIEAVGELDPRSGRALQRSVEADDEVVGVWLDHDGATPTASG